MPYSNRSVGGVLVSLSEAVEPMGGYTTACHAWLVRVTPDLRLPSQPQSTDTDPWPILISHPAEGRVLSGPEWLVTHQDGIHANGHPSQY